MEEIGEKANLQKGNIFVVGCSTSEVIGAKTGYVVQSKSCAVSYGTFGASETPYICVTAGSNSSWRCIYDQVEIYTRYVPKDAAGVEVPDSTGEAVDEE